MSGTLTNSSKVQVAVLIPMLGALAANIWMVAEINQRGAVLERSMGHAVGDIAEIKQSLGKLSDGMAEEIRRLRGETVDLRERLSRLEAQIAIKSGK